MYVIGFVRRSGIDNNKVIAFPIDRTVYTDRRQAQRLVDDLYSDSDVYNGSGLQVFELTETNGPKDS